MSCRATNLAFRLVIAPSEVSILLEFFGPRSLELVELLASPVIGSKLLDNLDEFKLGDEATEIVDYIVMK